VTDRLLDKYTKRGDASSSATSDLDDAENLGCFGWLRGVRDRAIMLELRKKDGSAMAFAYAWLERVECQPDLGLILHFPGRSVVLKGSGLNTETRPTVRLFDGIVRQRVAWIRESGGSEFLNTLGQPCLIESIDWGD
jgi:hypothetical protein